MGLQLGAGLPHSTDPVSGRITSKDVFRVDSLVASIGSARDRLAAGGCDWRSVLEFRVNGQDPISAFLELGHVLFPLDIVLSLSRSVQVFEKVEGTGLFVICFIMSVKCIFDQRSN